MADRRKSFQKQEQEFEQRVVDVARVTRVMKGGKRMSFRATLAIGDKKGRVGIGTAKGNDVTLAIQKAFTKAKKSLIKVPIVHGTIPHEVRVKFKSAKLLLKPAKQGTGVKAGGAPRILFELAGIGNISAKVLGTNNKLNNVKATMVALSSFKKGKRQMSKKAETPVEASTEKAPKKTKQSITDKIKKAIAK